MGFANYFDKNAVAASQLLQGMQADAFKLILKNEVIGIAFDKACNTAEGGAAVDLVIRLVARLYPTLTLQPLDGDAKKKLSQYASLASSINPEIELRKTSKGVTKALVVGAVELERINAEAKVFYIGSDNWFAKLSSRKPVGSGKTANPFGAGTAACFGVANIFRASFVAQLPNAKADADILFSALEMGRVTGKAKNPAFKNLKLGEMHLVGAGAIGNGVLWAAARLRGSGDLHIVDPEKLERSNLQRYAMTTAVDEGERKAVLAKRWLSETGFRVHAHEEPWETYLVTRDNWHIERVAVAVDSAETRINVQAALPRQIFNSWTQAGEVGVSRHGFLGEDACLACLYIPTEQTMNLDRIIARALGLPEDDHELGEIRKRLDLGLPTERAFLERIAQARNVAIDRLVEFENRPLRDFYLEAVCGGAVLEFGGEASEARADVPMAFQSALSGILLTADVVSQVAGLRPGLPTITQINLLNALPKIVSRLRRKSAGTKCMCADEDFKQRYREKYSLA